MLMAAVGVFTAQACAAQAQEVQEQDAAVSSALPDAPEPAAAASHPRRIFAGFDRKYIPADKLAVPLDGREKVVFGLRDAISPESLLVWTLAAGYEQVVNGTPNYGTNRTAFAQRFGAAAARDTSETLLVDSVFAPVFRQDPRYYKLGPQRAGYTKRVLYAVTRPLITRTDAGALAPNYALLSGDLAGTILTNAYYPELNRGPRQTAMAFGGSLGAIALGNAIQEFRDDLLDALEHKEDR